MIRIKKEKNYGSWRKWEKFWQSSSFTYFFLLFFFWRKEFELKFCFMFCFPKLAYFSFFFKAHFITPLYMEVYPSPFARPFSTNPFFPASILIPMTWKQSQGLKLSQILHFPQKSCWYLYSIHILHVICGKNNYNTSDLQISKICSKWSDHVQTQIICKVNLLNRS